MGNCVKKLAAELLSAAIAVTMISGPVSAYAAEPQATPAPQESDEVILLEEDIEENTLLTLGGAYTLNGRTLTKVFVKTETLNGASELSALRASEEKTDQEPGETLPEEKDTEEQTEAATETEAAMELQSGAPQEPVTEEQTEATDESGAPKETEAVTEKQTEASETSSETEAETEKNETMTKVGGESESETEIETETEMAGESETGETDESETESETGMTDESETERETGMTDESKIGETDESETERETGETDESETESEIGETDESETETEAGETDESETETAYVELGNGNEMKITVIMEDGAGLPADTSIEVMKLSEDSEEYKKAREAADKLSGTNPSAPVYDFYSVKLISNGEELNPAPGKLTVQIELMSIGTDSETSRDIIRIKDGEAAHADEVTQSSASFKI